MKKMLPDRSLLLYDNPLETEETQRLKCHLQLHLGLGKLSAGFDLHGNHIIFKLYRKKGRKERGREDRKEGKDTIIIIKGS